MSTPPNAEPPQPIPRIPDALLIAGFTLLGYLFAFVYEAGYATVFGFPVALVSLSLTSVFVAAGTFYLLLSVIFWFANFIAMVLHDVQGPIRPKVVRLTPILLLCASYAVLYGKRWRDWIWFPALLFILAAIEFLVPILRYRGTIRDRLATSEASPNLGFEGTLIAGFARRFGATWMKGVFWLILVLSICYSAGRATALGQEEFLVASTSPERAVLRIYGDQSSLLTSIEPQKPWRGSLSFSRLAIPGLCSDSNESALSTLSSLRGGSETKGRR